LYQWGRAKDGHESRDSGITKTLASSITPATTTQNIIWFQRGTTEWVKKHKQPSTTAINFTHTFHGEGQQLYQYQQHDQLPFT
jgi:hypothetical protein